MEAINKPLANEKHDDDGLSSNDEIDRKIAVLQYNFDKCKKSLELLRDDVNKLKYQSESPAEKPVKKKIWFQIIGAILFTGKQILPYLFRSKRLFLKIVWLILYIVYGVLCTWFVFDNITNYLKHDVITRLKVKSVQSLVFPAVTVCVSSQSTLHVYRSVFDQKPITNVSQMLYANKKCVVYNGFTKSMKPSKNIQLLIAEETGKKFGLRLRFLLPQYNHVNVYIGDNYDLPKIRYTENLLLEKGKLHDLLIKKFVDESLGEPYNECLENLSSIDSFDSDLYRHTIQNDYTYHQANCFDLCACKNLVSSGFNCTCPGIYDTGHTENCYLNSIFTQQLRRFAYSDCSGECPLECNSVYFSHNSNNNNFKKSATDEASFQNYITINEQSLGRNQIKQLSIENDSLGIDIFYDDLTFSERIEIAKTTEADLVSAIGGTLGLFLGLNLLSFGEILDLVMELLRILFD